VIDGVDKVLQGSVADGVAPGFGSLQGQRRALLVEGGPESTVTRRTWTGSSVACLWLVDDDPG
jgi:hypothetical protein